MVTIIKEERPKLDKKIDNAIELIRRNENREAFSILSKQLFFIAKMNLEKKDCIDNEESFFYKYDLVFNMIKKYKMKNCFNFLIHLIFIDVYLSENNFTDISYSDEIRKFNFLLITFIEFIMNSNSEINFNIEGYNFYDNLIIEIEKANVIYFYYRAKFDSLELEININDYKNLRDKIEEIQNIPKTESDFVQYNDLITEEDIENVIRERNRRMIIEKLTIYKNQFTGTTKTSPLKNVKGRIEDFIHQFVYMHFINEFKASYVFSELAMTGYRYDMFISNLKEKLSFVLEFKVFRDSSSNVDEAIEQVKGYLENGKKEILKRELDFAVILVFNSTGKNIDSKNNEIKENNGLYFLDDEDRILICEIKM